MIRSATFKFNSVLIWNRFILDFHFHLYIFTSLNKLFQYRIQCKFILIYKNFSTCSWNEFILIYCFWALIYTYRLNGVDVEAELRFRTSSTYSLPDFVDELALRLSENLTAAAEIQFSRIA